MFAAVFANYGRRREIVAARQATAVRCMTIFAGQHPAFSIPLMRARSTFVRDVPVPVRAELGAISGLRTVTRSMPAGTELYRQRENCDSCFVVLNGWIALSVLLDDGACQILDFALPGAFLGFPLAPAAPMHHSARCLTPVKVCTYPRQQLSDVIEHNPKLAFLMYRLAGFNESRAHDHLTNLGLRSARDRIAHLIVELYVRLHNRLPATAGETFQIPLTQSQIGQAVGLTGVHVSRTLRALREQRIAQFTKRGLLIFDPTALARAAGLEHLTCNVPQDRLGATTAPSRVRSCADAAANYLIPAGWDFRSAVAAA